MAEIPPPMGTLKPVGAPPPPPPPGAIAGMPQKAPLAGPPPKKGGMSLFAKKPVAAPIGPSPELARIVTTVSRRVRMMEERYENLRRKTQLLEDNLLVAQKKLFAEIKATTDDTLDFKEKMKDMQSKLLMLINEIHLLAKKEDIDVLKRYIEMWDPVKFVNRQQVERIVHSILDDKGF